MKRKILAILLCSSLMLIPVGANAASYRAKSYCCKTFNCGSGKVTASVSYVKNVSLLKDSVECIAYTSGSCAVNAKCCYNETKYYSKTLVDQDSLDKKEAKKKVANANTYGKLVLSGDTTNTLYADE